MSIYEGPIQDLIEELGRLPGVGPKSAQRLAFHLLQVDIEDAERLADAIRNVKQKVKFCDRCYNVSELAECRICRDARRDPTVLCVVEEPRDVLAIEKTGEFRGRYHVLGGGISPISRARKTRLPNTRRIGCAKLPAVYCVAGSALGKPQSHGSERRTACDASRWMASAAIEHKTMGHMTHPPAFTSSNML